MNANQLTATLIMLKFTRRSPNYNVYFRGEVELHIFSEDRLLIGRKSSHSYELNLLLNDNIIEDILSYEKKVKTNK